ncbi:MAG: hypothetical protein ACRESZ_23140 [Methylococcales bacterium]
MTNKNLIIEMLQPGRHTGRACPGRLCRNDGFLVMKHLANQE